MRLLGPQSKHRRLQLGGVVGDHKNLKFATTAKCGRLENTMNNFNEMFATSTSTTYNARNLPGTAELTAYANEIARNMIQTMEADIDNYRDKIQQSANDTKVMDAIISELKPAYDDIQALFDSLDEKTIDGMLKSQQSKRSRAKSKAMTMDNYLNMLTAAIAENIIRTVTGKTKAHSGSGRAAGVVDYTGAELEMFAADQEALRREIRNVQSKKSIMKSKADFDETDERWMALLKAEQQLKDLRVSNHVVEIDRTRDALMELIGEVEINKLHKDDAIDLLNAIKGLLVDDAE